MLFILLLITILFIKFPSVAKGINNFIQNDTSLLASHDEVVNILVMGKSGGKHDGADLTDTMILVSLSLRGDNIKTVSIPRDIWIPEIRAKINSAYYWGKNGSPYINSVESGGGIGLAKKITQEVVGQPIQYGVVVDFSSFKDIVDALGGIEVNVTNGFTDKLYPIEGRENDLCGGDKSYACRYETITFDAGVQKMNGETSLKFVRSRHSEGTEGTDIAREARQQKVINAIKNKALEPKTFLSIKKDIAILKLVQKYIETDIDLPVAGALGREALDTSNKVTQLTMPEDLLVVPSNSRPYDNLYVFIPKAGSGNWSEVNKWFTLNLAN